jgi:peptide/nickel transport system permease protein
MRYFLQKLVQFLIVFFVVTFAVLILMRLGLNAPGDPARTLLGGTADQVLIERTTKEYHLDQNYFVQYFYFVKGLVTGDMGFSVQYSTPVSTYIKGRILTTVLLGVYAMVIALAISIPIAVRSAYKRDAPFDKAASGVSFLFISVPSIVLAVFLKFIFFDWLGWFPRIGSKPTPYPWEGTGDQVQSFLLPVLVIAAALFAAYFFARRRRQGPRARDKETPKGIALLAVAAIAVSVVVNFVFFRFLQWLPRIGPDVEYDWEHLGRHFKDFFLPVMTLALPLAAVFTRLLRSDMVMTLQQDFITLASAKGVPPRRVLWGHALRNSLFSLITSVGIQLGALIGGAVVAETFFELDGMGGILVAAILGKDLFTVQAISAILVTTVVIVNLIIDLMYAVIDPRIRQARQLA